MKRLAFSDDMMRAIAAGAKTMTRRLVKPKNPVIMVDTDRDIDIRIDADGLGFSADFPATIISRPRFVVGDLVAATCAWDGVVAAGSHPHPGLKQFYRYNLPDNFRDLSIDRRWAVHRSARFMPAALAPFVLRITEVRAERLGEITDEDAIDEGMLHWITRTHLFPDTDPSACFQAYWCELYGAGAWQRDRESWVWVYRFEVEERRIG